MTDYPSVTADNLIMSQYNSRKLSIRYKILFCRKIFCLTLLTNKNQSVILKSKKVKVKNRSRKRGVYI